MQGCKQDDFLANARGVTSWFGTPIQSSVLGMPQLRRYFINAKHLAKLGDFLFKLFIMYAICDTYSAHGRLSSTSAVIILAL